MTLITDMDLPDDVVLAAHKAYHDRPLGMRDALRAALQAMVDGGMARVVADTYRTGDTSKAVNVLLIPLDTSDEHKREEQT